MKNAVVLAVFLAVFAGQAISDTPHKESEFVFARVQFNMGMRALLDFAEAPWHHDYPFSEHLVLTMLQEITNIKVTPESYQIVQLDDEVIFNYPFLYFSEPGYMQLTPAELTNLREWFNRGGFAFFDDFRLSDLDNLRQQMRKVFPDREMFRLDISHPIFNTFYNIETLDMEAPYPDPFGRRMQPEFWGLTDEDGRLIAVANHNNDFGELWEWVDKGEMPFQPAALSVKFAINYLIYAMTH